MKWNRDFPTFDEYCEITEDGDVPVSVLLVECDDAGNPIDKHIILSASLKMGWSDMDYIWFDYSGAIGIEYETGLYDDIGEKVNHTECYITIYLDRGERNKKGVYYMFIGWAEIEGPLEDNETVVE